MTNVNVMIWYNNGSFMFQQNFRSNIPALFPISEYHITSTILSCGQIMPSKLTRPMLNQGKHDHIKIEIIKYAPKRSLPV